MWGVNVWSKEVEDFLSPPTIFLMLNLPEHDLLPTFCIALCSCLGPKASLDESRVCVSK